jgi:hypothetical protein
LGIAERRRNELVRFRSLQPFFDELLVTLARVMIRALPARPANKSIADDDVPLQSTVLVTVASMLAKLDDVVRVTSSR